MNDKIARAVKGVVSVVALKNSVAVLATNTYNAKKGKEALEIVWNDKAQKSLSSANLFSQYKEQALKVGAIARMMEMLKLNFQNLNLKSKHPMSFISCTCVYGADELHD